MMNQRLLSVARVDTDVEDKLALVKQIIAGQSSYRMTPELLNWIACSIIDHGTNDVALIGKVAQRLLQLKMTQPLYGLLKYSKRVHDAAGIPSIATYYSRMFESCWEGTDDLQAMISLIYFLVG